MRSILFLSILFQIDLVDRNYQLLGLMWEDNTRINADLSNYRSLKGFLENNKRLDYSDEARREQVSIFFLFIHFLRL